MAPAAGAPRGSSVVTVRAVAPHVVGQAVQAVRSGVVQPSPTTQQTATTPIRTQIQIIQSQTGQLQVRGLLPGQQLVRLSDGRLQLITLPPVQASAATAVGTVAPTVTAPATPQTIQIATIRQPSATVMPALHLIAPQGQQQATGVTQTQVGLVMLIPFFYLKTIFTICFSCYL